MSIVAEITPGRCARTGCESCRMGFYAFFLRSACVMCGHALCPSARWPA